MLKNISTTSQGFLVRATAAATQWVGSVSSLVAHTLFFAGSFALAFLGFNIEHILLVVTTLVSLEAIYLAIFIQMAINQQTKSIDEIEHDIDEIERDLDEIQQDESEEEIRDKKNALMLAKIEKSLTELMLQIEQTKNDLR